MGTKKRKSKDKGVPLGARPKDQPKLAKPELTRVEIQRTIMCLKGMVRNLGQDAKTYSEQELIKEYKSLISKLDGALMMAEGGALAMKIQLGAEWLAVAE